ncbi:MAG: pentapeptide repeat-containing protein [Rothia sp.]|uniref:pentapeptide repeat-containing protein n=1 Tax=Rothia sp. (in: high G+C Gram-positive bacteria) TaxID=1885016 RepID=UPI001CB57614|nr:pentapeptide repeat-containing protein [Rothia sp. (in: high G+C Gram-positive bacteria)]MBF1680822.1 pentapeptide repeat-containing protein [Rothia sp. (in: high G+C Gram-positive bacteria)]
MNLNKLLTALRQRTNAPARNQQAERRERYTHALEQFLDGQPAVRLGGAYTLVNLADEWLTDASLPEQVRREEAQTIIDTLTGCIRTPYPLAQKRQVLEADEAPEEYEGDFTHDQEALREEQLVRRTVFMEFSRRLAAVSKSTEKDNKDDQPTVPPISPMWADLRFDFGGAPIFYPLRQLHFQNADFASATFYGPADFSGATFRGDTSFSAAQFTADASFHSTSFTDWVGFSAAHFAGAAEFSGAHFADAASFATVTFTGEADFSDAVFSAAADFAVSAFKSDANFSRLNTAGIASFAAVTFGGKAVFTASTFHDEAHFAASVFNRPAVFSKSLFGGVARFAGIVTKQSAMFSKVRFTGAADFSGASFTQYEDFGGARFDGDATFSRASFIALPRTRYEMDFPQHANFGNAAFAQNADFSKATFTAHVGFYKATFAREVSFNGASFEGAYFADATFSQKADFSQTSFAYVGPSFEALERRLRRARFSAQADPQDYLFEARPESTHGFSCGEATLLNRTFVLPLGAVLYDPDSWDEENQEYTHVSEPAQ